MRFLKIQRYLFLFLCWNLSLVELHSVSNPSEYLIFSTERGYLAHVKKALAQGADVNTKDYFKRTPLMYACQYGNPEIVHLLIKYGAANSINWKDRDGKTALVYAKEKGHTAIAEIIIQNGGKEE